MLYYLLEGIILQLVPWWRTDGPMLEVCVAPILPCIKQVVLDVYRHSDADPNWSFVLQIATAVNIAIMVVCNRICMCRLHICFARTPSFLSPECVYLQVCMISLHI